MLVRIFTLDSKGLLLDNRKLDAYKLPFAHSRDLEEWEYKGDQPSIEEVIRQAGYLHARIDGQPGAFGQRSNWYTTIHIAQLSSASPIQPASLKVYLVISYLGQTEKLYCDGQSFSTGYSSGTLLQYRSRKQCIRISRLGVGAVVAKSKITDNMVLDAAYALAAYTSSTYGKEERIYPELNHLRAVCKDVAVAVQGGDE